MALRADQPGVREAIAALGKGQGRRSKFNAVRTTVDGLAFDSKKEAAYWGLLRLRERNGSIRHLERQPVFELHAPSGEIIGAYRGDMRFEELIEGRWRVRVIDVKGMRTLPLARWKQKHLRAEYGVVVEEIR